MLKFCAFLTLIFLFSSCNSNPVFRLSAQNVCSSERDIAQFELTENEQKEFVEISLPASQYQTLRLAASFDFVSQQGNNISLSFSNSNYASLPENTRVSCVLGFSSETENAAQIDFNLPTTYVENNLQFKNISTSFNTETATANTPFFTINVTDVSIASPDVVSFLIGEGFNVKVYVDKDDKEQDRIFVHATSSDNSTRYRLELSKIEN